MTDSKWRIVLWVPQTDTAGQLQSGFVLDVKEFDSKIMAIRFGLQVGASGKPMVKAGARTYNVEVSIQ